MMGHIQYAVLHCIGLQASGTKHGTGAISDGSATGRRRAAAVAAAAVWTT